MNYAELTIKKKRKTRERISFATFDIETKDGLKGKELYCWSLATRPPKSRTAIVDSKHKGSTIESLSRLFDYALERIKNVEKPKNLVIFVHNLGFDIRFIEEYCIIHDIDNKPLLSGSNMIGYVIDDYKLIFRDSFQFLLSSQARAEIEWNIDKKLTKIDCSDIFNKDFNDWSIEDKIKVIDHNENDVLALHSILRKFRNYIFKISHIDMLFSYTIAALSLRIFQTTLKNNIPNPYLYFKKNKIGKISYGIDDEKYRFVQKSYFGGRTEPFNINFLKRIAYVDKVSHYPYEMKNNHFPIGIPYWISNSKEIEIALDSGLTGFIHCSYKPSKLKFPVLPAKRNGKLCFTNEMGNGVYATPEIRYALECNYEIEFHKALFFIDEEKIFVDYIHQMYTIKQNEIGGRKRAGKILLNALYGKFGQDFYRDEPIIIFANSIDEFMEKLDEEQITDEIQPKFSEHFGKYYYIAKRTKVSAKPFQLMHLSSLITSYARVSLLKFIHKLERMGIDVYYCDSDSVAIDMKHLNKLDLSHEIGCWDIEETYDEVRFLAPKGYFGIKYVSNLSTEELEKKLRTGWKFMKDRNKIAIIKLKGAGRQALNEIIGKSETIYDLDRLLREPIKSLERYDTFKSSLRYGFALRTRKLTKNFSFEFGKRKVLPDLTTEAWC